MSPEPDSNDESRQNFHARAQRAYAKTERRIKDIQYPFRLEQLRRITAQLSLLGAEVVQVPAGEGNPPIGRSILVRGFAGVNTDAVRKLLVSVGFDSNKLVLVMSPDELHLNHFVVFQEELPPPADVLI